MARNLDEFAADLTQATAAALRAAGTTANAQALIQAAQSGDQAKVERLASSMTTAELQAVKQQLEA